MTVFLAVDISQSGDYGSHGPSKREVMAELAAVLAFSATQNKDKVGLVLFSGEIELFIPPQKSRQHCLRIIREVLFHEAEGKGNGDLKAVSDLLMNGLKKRSLVFLMSDFLFEDDIEKRLRTISRKHDLNCRPDHRSSRAPAPQCRTGSTLRPRDWRGHACGH